MTHTVTLTAAVRQNLLSLQSTADLISRTQNRLSTGLRVASALDDAVAYFQAKGLTDRATDFVEKKQGIDQGISTLTAATDAVTGVQNLVQQLKVLATNAKSATTTTEIDNIVAQFNDLRTQINNLTMDATYQGLNLVNGTGSTLTVSFSGETASRLTVASVDTTSAREGLHVKKVSAIVAADTMSLHQNTISAGTFAATAVLTVAGTTSHTLTAGNQFTLKLGTLSFSVITIATTTADATTTAAKGRITAGIYSIGDTITFTIETSGNSGTGTLLMATNVGTGLVSIETIGTRVIGVGTTEEQNDRILLLNSALTSLRSRAQVLGANVAILNTRLDFTSAYVNTLTAGSGKLTLADLNEEGANLLALQTRQQLGIQSLAFAGQSEQSILGLFR